MNYVEVDAVVLHSVHHQAKMLSCMKNKFVKSMRYSVTSLIHSPTSAKEEKKSQQYLPMIVGMTALEEIQRKRVVEWAKMKCQSVLLHSSIGGFTSSLLYMVDVNDISAHILLGDIINNNLFVTLY